MIRNTLKLLVLLAACFVALELSYRVYAIGPRALNPLAMDSMSALLHSGLVQPADNTETWFELRPDLDAWHMGARLRTNSRGLADREHSVAKPPGVFRIAVIGSSWSMASGVDTGAAWPDVLERQLAERDDGVEYEVVNFAVEQYGLREMVGTLRHKVPAWEPDLVIAAITSTTAYFRWKDEEPFVTLPQRHVFFESFILRAAGLAPRSAWPQRETLGQDVEAFTQQIERAIVEFDTLAEAAGARLCVAWLGFVPLARKVETRTLAVTGPRDIPIIRAYEPILAEVDRGWGQGYRNPEYQVSRFDEHPNEQAHILMADVIARELAEQGLLPSGDSRDRAAHFRARPKPAVRKASRAFVGIAEKSLP